MAPAAATTPGAAPVIPAMPAPSGWALAASGMHQQPASGLGEAAPLHQEECASWGARFGAYLLDGIILAVLSLVTFGIVAGIVGVAAPEFSDRVWDDMNAPDAGSTVLSESDEIAVGLLIMGFGLVVVLVSAIWNVLWLRSAGMAKPGQRAAGFRVVRLEDLERLGVGRSIGRTAASMLYSIPYVSVLTLIASAFTIGLTDRRQSLHDLIASTVCVRKDALARRGIGPDAVGAGTYGGVPYPGSAHHATPTSPAPASHAPPSTYAPPSAPPPLPPRPGSTEGGPFIN
ncbi:MAG: hypothetical protein JWM25_1562 [Thermoleophilia bacterium]|nr:hypothetical protein [Thermoleophilia bacterium]MCZ4496977.1 hypothetical protein [Thermoleophilia bacterium]